MNYKMAHSVGNEKPKTKRKFCGQCENKAALLVSTLQRQQDRPMRTLRHPLPRVCFHSPIPITAPTSQSGDSVLAVSARPYRMLISY